VQKQKISKFPITNKFLWNPKTLKCREIGWTSFESRPPSYVMTSLLEVQSMWAINANSFPKSKFCVCVRLLFCSLFFFCFFPQIPLSSYFVFKFVIFSIFLFFLFSFYLLAVYVLCARFPHWRIHLDLVLALIWNLHSKNLIRIRGIENAFEHDEV
jgi:hypothetical protein